ncbi:MAG: DUF4443 domain-containing protein [Methanomassiliicoccales archaeon]
MNSPFSELVSSGGGGRGPQRRFGPFHYYKALYIISTSGRTGRKRVSEELGIGEGSTRTLLNDLESLSLIVRNNAGMVITADGIAALRSMRINLLCLDAGIFGLPGHCCLSLVRGGGSKLSDGIAQRDASVKAGGEGAVSMRYVRGRLLLPPDMREFGAPISLTKTLEELGAADGDAVIVAFAHSRILSEQAAFQAAMTLL